LTFRPQYTHVRLAIVLIVALAVRWAAGSWWQSRLPGGAMVAFGDSDSYLVLGRALAAGMPYEYGSPDARIMRMPGYPLLLAAAFQMTDEAGHVMAARRLNALLGVVAVWAVFWLGSIVFDRSAGLTAAIAAALYPGAIGTSVFVLSEAPFSPILVLQIATAIKSWRADDLGACVRWSAATGILAGLGVLMRPSWLLFPPFILACGLIGKERKRRSLSAGIALVAAAAVLAPWWVRNVNVVGHFVPTTLTAGATLYDGWHDGATGGSDMAFLAPIAASEVDLPTLSPEEPFEYRLNARLQREAWEWAVDHPQRVLELAAEKTFRFWSPWPYDSPTSWPIKIALAASYLPLLAAGVWTAWRFRSAGWACAPCWLPLAYLSLLHLVFVGSMRYREPGMLPLLVLASGLAVGAAPRDLAQIPTRGGRSC
jgi:4-amino-4-deoxy-L-arabinose transferase-like glycosyltransferase